jgi:transcriptional regulator with XRE-family HTH domain
MVGNSAVAVRRKLGRCLAELRVARGFTQEAFAELANVSSRYLQSIEGGHENLTLDSLCELANRLDVQVVELFGEPKAPRAAKGRPRKGPTPAA